MPCLRRRINKSVSSLEAHGVFAPGPIFSLKIYGSDSSFDFLVKIFEVSAFALNKSSEEITGEWLRPFLQKMLWISEGSIFAVRIVSTSVFN